jgi:hypothetical protein
LSRFLPEWEWGWKTPLLLDPLAFAASSDASLLARAPKLISELLDPSWIDRLPFPQADEALAACFEGLKTSRVGIRFERVQEVLLRLHPRTLDLRAGIQIARKTEVDLLQRIEPDSLIHWEIAVKFYLALDPVGSPDPVRWVGPGLRDTLGSKMRRIRERQLPALASLEDREAIGLSPRDRVLALPKIHGILFLPFAAAPSGASTGTPENPEGISESGLRGVWCESAHLSAYFSEVLRQSGTPRIRSLDDRKEWIRDQRLVDGIPEETPSDALASRISQKIEASGEPAQFAVVDRERKSEARFFVVPDGWRIRAEAAMDSLRSPGKLKT